MRRVRLAGLLLLAGPAPLLATQAAPAQQAEAGTETIGYGPAPAWVVPPPAPLASASTDALSFDLLDGQIRVGRDGITGYSLLRLTARTPEALQAAAGTLSLVWQPANSRVTVHHVRLVRAGGTVDLLAGGKRMTVLRREENLERAALDGRLTAVMQPEGMRVGDTLEFAFSITESDPILAGHAQLLLPNMLATPARHLRYMMDWSERPAFRAFAGERLAARRTPTSLRIDLPSPPIRQFPENAPTRFLRSSAIEGTSFASWAEVSTLLAPLYTGAAALPASSAVREEAKRIIAAHPDKAGRLIAALRLVQDEVRYLFLGMDLGGYRPSSAEETWTRRFGDCKGKTALLLALLGELEILARPALVHSRLGDGLDSRLPMPGQFDHVIVRAELDGRTLWLDGTRTGDRTLDDLSPPPFRWALPLGPGVTGPERLVTSALRAPASELGFDVDASAGLDRPARAIVSRTYRGAAATELRRDIQLTPESQRQDVLKQFFDKGWSRLETEKVTERWDDSRAELTLTAQGRFDLELGSENGVSTYSFPARRLAMPEPFERGPAVDKADSALPFLLPFPYDEVERHSLLLPETGQSLKVQEPDIDRELGGWRIERRIRSKGRRVSVDIRERTLAPEIGQAAAAAAREGLAALYETQVQISIPGRSAQPGSSGNTGTETARKAGIWSGLKAVLAAAGPEAALKAMEAMPQGTIDDPDFDVMRWMLMEEVGRGDEAARLARAAAEARPDDPVIMMGEARLLAGMGRADEALSIIDRRIARKPSAQALTMRAELGTGRPLADRLKDLDAANRIEPAYASAWWMRGIVLAQNKQPDAALAAVNEALTRFPEEPEALLLRAELLEGKGEKAAALADLDRVIELQPGNAQYWNNRCWFRATNSYPPEQALTDCNRALEIAPKYAPALDSRGLVHLQLGKLKEALADYDAALEIAPDMGASLWGRGVTRRRLGDLKGGDADLAKARAASPTIDKYMAGTGIRP